MAQSFLLHKIHEIDTTFAGNGGKRNDGMAETKCVGFIESIPLIETLWRAFTNHPYGREAHTNVYVAIFQNAKIRQDRWERIVGIYICCEI